MVKKLKKDSTVRARSKEFVIKLLIPIPPSPRRLLVGPRAQHSPLYRALSRPSLLGFIIHPKSYVMPRRTC